MLLRKLSISLLLIFFGSVVTITTHAQQASQESCCMKFLNGEFLPLACGDFLGGSILTLMERGHVPPMCGPMMTPAATPYGMYPMSGMLMYGMPLMYNMPLMPDGMPLDMYGMPLMFF